MPSNGRTGSVIGGVIVKRVVLVLAGLCLLLPGTASADETVPGVMVLTGTRYGNIEVPPRTSLVGIGNAKVVGTVTLRDGSSVENVEITNWRDRKWNYAAGVMVLGDNATVRNNHIHHGPSHGVLVIGGRVGAKIIGNHIAHVGAWQMSGSSRYPMASWRGISLEAGSHGAQVINNVIEDTWESAIFEHGSHGVVLRGNSVLRPNRGRVDLWNSGSGNGIETLGDFAVIEENIIEGSGKPGSYFGRNGITVGGESSIVARNQIRRVTGSGIRLIGDSDGRLVLSNRIEDVAGWMPSEAGIRLFVFDGSTKALGTIIAGNHISQVRGGLAIRTGTRHRVDFSVVSGNVINGLRLLLEGPYDTAFGNI